MNFEVMTEGKPVSRYKDRIFSLPTDERSIVLRIKETNYRHVLPVSVTEGAPQILTVALHGDLTVNLLESRFLSGTRHITDAKIYLNNTEVGKTGKKITGILAGTYDMVVDYKGQRKSKQISIRPESPLMVIYTLKKEKSDRRSGKNLSDISF